MSDLEIPSYNPDVEAWILGACMILDLRGAIIEATSPLDFYRPAHSLIFGHIRKLFIRGTTPTLMAVRDSLDAHDALQKAGGVDYLISCAEGIASHTGQGEWEHYFQRLKDYSYHRAAKRLSHKLARALEERDPAEALALARLEVERLDKFYEFQARASDIPFQIASEIIEERQEFLMFPWIPKGGLTLIDAPPETGKTMLGTHIVAQLSVGSALPGRVPQAPMKCWVILYEDSPARRWVPGLKAEGGNLDNVIFTRRWKGGLDADSVAKMEKFILHNNIGFTWVDPIMSLLAPSLGENGAFYAARPLLDNLSAMLEAVNQPMAALRHLTNEQEKELKRNKGVPARGGSGYGHIDLRAAARSILTLVAGQEDERGKIVKVWHSKANGTAHSAPAQFRIMPATSTTAKVQWTFIPNMEPPCTVSLKEFLENILETGTKKRQYVLSLTRGAGFKDDETKLEAASQGVIETIGEGGDVEWTEKPDPFAE